MIIITYFPSANTKASDSIQILYSKRPFFRMNNLFTFINKSYYLSQSLLTRLFGFSTISCVLLYLFVHGSSLVWDFLHWFPSFWNITNGFPLRSCWLLLSNHFTQNFSLGSQKTGEMILFIDLHMFCAYTHYNIYQSMLHSFATITFFPMLRSCIFL